LQKVAADFYAPYADTHGRLPADPERRERKLRPKLDQRKSL
jgi:hypothetical protein